jgi:hypothetical protein
LPRHERVHRERLIDGARGRVAGEGFDRRQVERLQPPVDAQNGVDRPRGFEAQPGVRAAVVNDDRRAEPRDVDELGRFDGVERGPRP